MKKLHVSSLISRLPVSQIRSPEALTCVKPANRRALRGAKRKFVVAMAAAAVPAVFRAHRALCNIDTITPGFGSANGVMCGPGRYASRGAIDWTSSAGVNISLAYNGSFIKETVSQGTNSYTQYVGRNLPGIVGSNTAFIGFSGGTGGQNAQQTVNSLIFTEGGVATIAIGPDYHWNSANDNWTNNAAWNPNT